MSRQHFDFKTPEYASFAVTVAKKWESTRGIGLSFGYNRNESPDGLLSGQELVRLLIDVTSRNGNLLLDVGPMADGTIPESQRQRLLELGRWLEVNGQAIYGTRPRPQAEGTTDGGLPLRFTQRDGLVYALLLERPQCDRLTLWPGIEGPVRSVELLGHAAGLSWRQAGGAISLDWPQGAAEAGAYALKLAI